MIKGLKICGVSDPETLNYILNHNHKPTMIGFITNYEKSKRFVDFEKLKDLIKEEVEERFDHKNLNMDVIEFKKLMPSAENIAVVIYNILKKKIAHDLDLEITLYETPRNFVKYTGP